MLSAMSSRAGSSSGEAPWRAGMAGPAAARARDPGATLDLPAAHESSSSGKPHQQRGRVLAGGTPADEPITTRAGSGVAPMSSARPSRCRAQRPRAALIIERGVGVGEAEALAADYLRRARAPGRLPDAHKSLGRLKAVP